MSKLAYYDPAKTYEENFTEGPFPLSTNEPLYVNEGEPQYEFFGHALYSPFGIPAGTLLNSNYVKYAFERGFDVLCYKTQRSREFPVNAFPNIVYVEVDGDLTLDKAAEPLIAYTETTKSPSELSITNSFGVPSKGPSYWIEDLKKALSYQGKGQLLIMSVVGTIAPGFTENDYFNDFAETAKIAVEAGAKVIEVNLSCPNVATEGVVCYSPKAVIEITKRTKAAIGDVPLIAKLGYFSTAQQGILEEIVEQTKDYCDCFSVINTIAAPIVDEHGEQALPGPNRMKAGVCGRSIRWAGLDMVKRLALLREQKGYVYKIIGVGGVMTAQDFAAYQEAGADIVQSATGSMWNTNLGAEVKALLKNSA